MTPFGIVDEDAAAEYADHMPDVPAYSWWHQRYELEAFAQIFDKSAKLKLKTSKLWGASKALQNFATTIGKTVYIPADWTVARVRRVIPHEVLGHVKQFRWCGLGIHPNLGIFPGMVILYLLLFLPIFLAWGRYRCELHAESKSWAYHLQQGMWTPTEVRERAVRFAVTVSSSAYGWAIFQFWAFWGFRRRAEKVIAKYGG